MTRLFSILLLVFCLQAQESPAPVRETPVHGSLDVGYRWVNDVRGDFNTYRSVVNLGEGPKLFGLDFVVEDPSQRLFDKLTASAGNWGGDPYNTARVDAERRGVYRVLFDYRNISYFNFLPSFANPRIEQGSLLNQRSFDTQRRGTNVELELFPGKRVIPYLAYLRDSGFGRGITPFVSNGNEYPVADTVRDKTDNYRGGIRVELNRFHLTLEQGGTTFKDDQRVFTVDRNFGNRSTPIFNQRLFLDELNQAYGIRGSSIYTKALLTAAPASWADVYGQFLFSQPSSDVQYTDNARGLFFLGAVRFFERQQSLLAGEAKQPHTSASAGFELRPARRLRIVESWMTDRFHNASSALLTEQILFAASPAELATAFTLDRLALNYHRQQVDLFYDLTTRLTIRGGHRYVWGDAAVRPAVLNLSGQRGTGELSRHVGLAGVNFRPAQRVSLNVDYEGSSGDKTYFRTSLQDYHQLWARGRYQVSPSLQLSGYFSLLDNQNPTQGIDYEFQSRSATLSLFWTPQDGKRMSLLGEYTRSSLRSDINFLAPETRDVNRSLYRDNAHTATAVLELNLPGPARHAPKFSLGGSLFTSSGSRPARYYQPLGRLLLPVSRNVQWYAEWRWYGFTQAFYVFEGFRSHQILTGLRFTM